MIASRIRPARRRLVLLVLLVVAILVLAGALAVLIPILTHQSAGSSGQEVPERFVSEATASGADGRERRITAETPAGDPARLDALVPGDIIAVRGGGFDSAIGIYVAICAIPGSPDQRPSPCLGGIPEGAQTGGAAGEEALSSVWITDDWAWRAFATRGYEDADRGTFSAWITVPEPVVEGLDCRETRCAIATRADHTAGADRVQDMLLPVAYAE